MNEAVMMEELPPKPPESWLTSSIGRRFKPTGECRVPGPRDYWVPIDRKLIELGESVGWGKIHILDPLYGRKRWILDMIEKGCVSKSMK